ncbi:MAG: Gfo/Idh/MocA family protein, partial [Anaerolineales bacterium]
MSKELRIGIIGLDTSHVPAFTRLLNDPEDPFHVPGGRVVAAFPSFSPDLEASRSRVEGFKEEITDRWDVEVVSSIAALLEGVDAVLLESVDGRRHLAEATPVIEAGKPLYIDKPLAANYGDAATIMDLAQENDCPLFSCSSLRFDANILAIKEDPELGQVLTCDAFSPATLDATNPGLFWYGIHGVEILYTFMGMGCEGVRCYSTEAY